MVVSGVQLALREGLMVTIEGTYMELNVNKRSDRPPVYAGRAAVLLSDGSSVILDIDDAGIRNQKEIETFRDRVVRATGRFEPYCTAWGGGLEASIIGPCLRDITSIIRADTE